MFFPQNNQLHWESAVKTLCDLINPFTEKQEVNFNHLDWDRLIAIADLTHVLPELYQGVVKHELLEQAPLQIQTLLVGVYDYLVQRNQLVRQQCDEITLAFNAQNIKPIWLKGAALLHLDDWTENTRIMNDIDLWVPDTRQQQKAIAILNEIGYINKQDHELWNESHHYSPFFHRQRISTVELHKHVIRPSLKKLLSNQECENGIQYFRRKTTLAEDVFDGSIVDSGTLEFGILSTEHRMIQSFVQCTLMASPVLDTGLIRMMKVVDLLRIMKQAEADRLPPKLINTLKAQSEWHEVVAQFSYFLENQFNIPNAFSANPEFQRKFYQFISDADNPKRFVRRFALFRWPATPLKKLASSPLLLYRGIVSRVKMLMTGKLY